MHSDNEATDRIDHHNLQLLPSEIINDLAVRFLLNAPPGEADSWERFISHVEEAYYFYCDQIVPVASEISESMESECSRLIPSENSPAEFDRMIAASERQTGKGRSPTLRPRGTLSTSDPHQYTADYCQIRMADVIRRIHSKYSATTSDGCSDLFPYLSFESFTAQILSRVLHFGLEEIMNGLRVFNSYKKTVNVCGVVLLNPRKTHVLAISAHKHSRLYFPKGKIMRNESDYECALREAREEIGVDLTKYLAACPLVSKHHKNFPPYRFFAAIGPWESNDVDPFQPQCRGEIYEVRWVDIDFLRTEYFRRGIAQRLRRKYAGEDGLSIDREGIEKHIDKETLIVRRECPFDRRRLSWMVNYYEEICMLKSL